MVRHYKKKKPETYLKSDLLEAIRAVRERGMKVSVAALKFRIPQSTLYDHTNKHKCVSIGAGAPTILSNAEEKEIVVINIASTAGDWFWDHEGINWFGYT